MSTPKNKQEHSPNTQKHHLSIDPKQEISLDPLKKTQNKPESQYQDQILNTLFKKISPQLQNICIHYDQIEATTRQLKKQQIKNIYQLALKKLALKDRILLEKIKFQQHTNFINKAVQKFSHQKENTSSDELKAPLNEHDLKIIDSILNQIYNSYHINEVEQEKEVLTDYIHKQLKYSGMMFVTWNQKGEEKGSIALPEHVDFLDVTGIQFNNINLLTVQTLIKYFPNLRKLSIGVCKSFENGNNTTYQQVQCLNIMNQVLHFRFLQQLTIPGVEGNCQEIFNNVVKMNSLKVLNIPYLKINDRQLINLVFKKRNLQKLTISAILITNEALMFLPKALPSLKSLNITNVNSSSKQISAISSFQNIQQLKLSFNHSSEGRGFGTTYGVSSPPPKNNQIGNIQLKQFIKSYDNMKIFHLNNIQFSDEGVRIIVQKMPLLEQLDLSSNTTIGARGYNFLGNLEYLRRLFLNMCNITDQVADILGKHKFRLTHLEMKTGSIFGFNQTSFGQTNGGFGTFGSNQNFCASSFYRSTPKVQQHKPSFNIGAIVRSQPQLIHLALNFRFIDSQGIQSIVRCAPNLVRLLLDGVKVSLIGMAYISKLKSLENAECLWQSTQILKVYRNAKNFRVSRYQLNDSTQVKRNVKLIGKTSNRQNFNFFQRPIIWSQ